MGQIFGTGPMGPQTFAEGGIRQSIPASDTVPAMLRVCVFPSRPLRSLFCCDSILKTNYIGAQYNSASLSLSGDQM
jgi:hypothetical protein